MQVLTEERGECRPVLERSEPVVALHEGLAQRARTRAAAAVDGVDAVPVRGRRLARQPAVCKSNKKRLIRDITQECWHRSMGAISRLD